MQEATRAMKVMMKGLEHLICEEKLGELGLFNMKKRNLCGTLPMCINS